MTGTTKAIAMTKASDRAEEAVDTRSLLRLPAAFVLGFLCVYVKSLVSMTTLVALPGMLDSGLFLFGATFLLIHILSNSKEYGKRFAPMLIIILACAYTYFASGETIPLTAALCIIAAATAGDMRDVAKLWLAASVMLVVYLVAASAITALLDPSRLSYSYRNAGDSARFSFFFNHPNMFAAIVMMMCGTYMYLCYERLRFSSFVIVALIALLTFVFTDSRTSFALTLFEIACFTAQRKWNLFSRHWLRCFISIMPILLLAAVFLISGPLYSEALGGLLTGRVSLWHNCLITQGVTILGQPFEPSHVVSDAGWIYYFETLDCAYASGLFVFGLVFMGFFCWCVFSRIRHEDSRLDVEIPLIATLLLFGITEVHALNPVICMPLLFLAGGILPGKNRGSSLSAPFERTKSALGSKWGF